MIRRTAMIIVVVLLLALGQNANAETISGISFGPYLQRVTETSATILLHTSTDEILKFYYRDAVGAWQSLSDSTATTSHRYRLTKLLADHAYQYYFVRQQRITPTYAFFTHRHRLDQKHPLKIAVVGDSGVLTTDTMRVVSQMQNWQPDLILNTGDIAYNSGTLQEYTDNFFKPYQALLSTVPIYTTIGNHDYATDLAGPYKAVFELPQRNSGTEDYYSFNYASVHIISINSNLDYSIGSVMYQWLATDLAAHQADQWKIVFFHHPPFSSGEHGNTVGMDTTLVPLFSNYHVNLVLNGHDHDYERNQAVDGVRYIVTGGGGNTLYRKANENIYSEVFVSEYHFTALSITPDAINLKAIDKRGYIFDSLKITH